MKNYVKPAISFQFFNLNSSGAGGCVIGSNLGELVCPVRVPDWPGEFIFTTDNADCTMEADPGQFCYQIPADSNRVLGS